MTSEAGACSASLRRNQQPVFTVNEFGSEDKTHTTLIQLDICSLEFHFECLDILTLTTQISGDILLLLLFRFSLVVFLLHWSMTGEALSYKYFNFTYFCRSSRKPEQRA